MNSATESSIISRVKPLQTGLVRGQLLMTWSLFVVCHMNTCQSLYETLLFNRMQWPWLDQKQLINDQ